MHRIHEVTMLDYMIQTVMKEKWEVIHKDETMLIRLGYQIAAERSIPAIDVIQALQLSVGTWPQGQMIENHEGLPKTLMEILKHSLPLSTWRRKIRSTAHYQAKRSALTYQQIMAEMEKISVEVLKEVFEP